MSNSQNLRLLSKKYTFFKKNHTVFVFELIKMFTKRRKNKIKMDSCACSLDSTPVMPVIR